MLLEGQAAVVGCSMFSRDIHVPVSPALQVDYSEAGRQANASAHK